MKRLTASCIFLISVATLCHAVVLPPSQVTETIRAEIFITDEVTSSGNPGQLLKEANLASKSINILTKFSGLSLGEHGYSCEIADGSGRTIFRSVLDVAVNSADFWIHTVYSPNRFSDKAGKWHFIVSIDGIEVSQSELQVNQVPNSERIFTVGFGQMSIAQFGGIAGGSYLDGYITVEPISDFVFGLRYDWQLFPVSFGDDLLETYIESYILGSGNFFSSISLVYANQPRKLSRGDIGIGISPFDNWHASNPKISLFPFQVFFDLNKFNLGFAIEFIQLGFDL